MENILFEAEILSRDYSNFRGGSKWRSHREQCIPLESLITSDGSYLMICKPPLGIKDYFPLPALLKRLEIKRSSSVFQLLHRLWQQLNPSSIRSISKSVYQTVVEQFYSQFQQSMANPTVVSSNLLHDVEIDFRGKLGLTFAEFYDCVFDIVDSLTKSSLNGEYVRAIHATSGMLSESSAFTALNLHSKLHLREPQRVCFYPWMQRNLRDLTPKRGTEQLPDILNHRSTKNLAPKFLDRVKNKIVKEESPVKWNMKSFLEIRKSSKSPVRSVTPKIDKKRTSNGCKKFEVEKYNPLSISPKKDKKYTRVLEDIIEERTVRAMRDAEP